MPAPEASPRLGAEQLINLVRTYDAHREVLATAIAAPVARTPQVASASFVRAGARVGP